MQLQVGLFQENAVLNVLTTVASSEEEGWASAVQYSAVATLRSTILVGSLL